jgi:hypothetical protein
MGHQALQPANQSKEANETMRKILIQGLMGQLKPTEAIAEVALAILRYRYWLLI